MNPKYNYLKSYLTTSRCSLSPLALGTGAGLQLAKLKLTLMYAYEKFTVMFKVYFTALLKKGMLTETTCCCHLFSGVVKMHLGYDTFLGSLCNTLNLNLNTRKSH